MQYNHLRGVGDFPRPDDGTWGLFLNQETSGYAVAHNVMSNSPGLLIAPSAGASLVTDNGGNPIRAEHTMVTAGIEPSYADIKDLAVSTARLLPGEALVLPDDDSVKQG